jgi:hypothetical protein
MADLVTDFRGAGQAGHRDTPKGVCPVLSHLLSGQMSRRVPSLSHVPVGPRIALANIRVRHNVCALALVAGAHGLVQRLVMDRAPSIFRQQQVAAVQAMAAATVRIAPKQRTCRTGT